MQVRTSSMSQIQIQVRTDDSSRGSESRDRKSPSPLMKRKIEDQQRKAVEQQRLKDTADAGEAVGPCSAL